jgi:hypothetical protein
MQLITKIRVVVLLAAAFIFISGLRSALHPGAVLATSQPTAMPGEPPSAEAYPEFVTSKRSRFFGIVRMLAGGGLALYVLLPWWQDRTRRH